MPWQLSVMARRVQFLTGCCKILGQAHGVWMVMAKLNVEAILLALKQMHTMFEHGSLQVLFHHVSMDQAQDFPVVEVR